MPVNAIRSVEVDYVLGVARMGPLIEKPATTRPERTQEPVIAEVGSHSIHLRQGPGDRDGAPWTSRDGRMTLHRCHSGDGYTERSLRTSQADRVELNLLRSIRAFEEHAEIHRRMGCRPGLSKERAGDLRRQAVEIIVVERAGRPRRKGQPAGTSSARREARRPGVMETHG